MINRAKFDVSALSSFGGVKKDRHTNRIALYILDVASLPLLLKAISLLSSFGGVKTDRHTDRIALYILDVASLPLLLKAISLLNLVSNLLVNYHRIKIFCAALVNTA